MDSQRDKVDALLLARLQNMENDSPVHVEIVPIQNKWRALIHFLRNSGSPGVEFNVIDLTSISARLPPSVIESIAARPDVVRLRLVEDD